MWVPSTGEDALLIIQVKSGETPYNSADRRLNEMSPH